MHKFVLTSRVVVVFRNFHKVIGMLVVVSACDVAVQDAHLFVASKMGSRGGE